jgi:ligand-binding sensor domain-containing protein
MLSFLRHISFLITTIFVVVNAAAQTSALNFHHLTVKNGLNDGIINTMVQDKYGYMWFASYGALNRFNGAEVKKFEHINGDSTSAPGGIVYALYCSSAGRLFIGGDDGLLEFDYATGRFLRIYIFTKTRITAINELSQDELLLVCDNKLYCYNLKHKTKNILDNKRQPDIFSKNSVSGLYRKENSYYCGTAGGYIIYNHKTGIAERREVKMLQGARADVVIADANNNVWVSNIFLFRLIRVNAADGTETPVDKHPAIAATGVQQSFLDFAADEDNVWIATSLTGLIQYSVHNNSVRLHQKNILKPGSIAENILRKLYRSPDGTIWVSMLGGADYFNPRKTLFDVLFPFPAADANQLARGFAEDKNGDYWFTTGDGIVRYTPSTNTYKIWRNETGKQPLIYYNSSRAVLAEGDNVWIATGKGINRYSISTGRMQFLTEKDGLPELFYLNINKDSKGFIWFCSNMGDGLYYFNPSDKKIQSIRHHSVLKKYTGFAFRRVFEDSKQRLWFGFSGQGYAMYNPDSLTTKYWYYIKGNDSSYNSNLVIDITEDKKEIVWLTTFNGVNGVDIAHNKKYRLTTADGLPSNVTNCILTDNYNRLWIGTSAGLALVDSDRRNIQQFDESYGFPSLEFPEHQAHTTAAGDFIFPSNKGYIKFKPEAASATPVQFPFYIADVAVKGRPANAYNNYKATGKIYLKPNENFFTITLEGLNYSSPGQTWYAYKMDGLEKDWHYTRDPNVVYTSVPGGNYTFRYKAAAGPGNWNMGEKRLSISVATVFYKTMWFWLLLAVSGLLIVFAFYRYRITQQRKMFILEGKAQQLEKEKTQVMYESLKQQLNPHFLFNSLTSLSGFIETDQRLAGSFLKQMSKIYRYILKSRDSETVKLKEEIEFVQTYINLQKTRFKNGLQVNMHIDEEVLHKKIPPVTFQIIVENAIKHNIIDSEMPLVIDMYAENGYLVIKNNLQRKNMVETSNKQGLSSLQSLYSYLSKRPLLIEEDEKEFKIKLPLI